MSKRTNHKTAIVVAGMWSTNIGNAFFQLGAQYIMSQAAPSFKVNLLADHLGYWQYGEKQEPKNSARLLDHINADYVVLSGSVLTYSFPELWANTLKIYKEHKIRVILLGVGQFDYSKNETSVCRDILKEFPPYAFISRDSLTFENFKGIAEHSYNGIDNAYFLPMAYPKINLDYPQYIVLNFDKGPEPLCRVIYGSDKYSLGSPGYNDCSVPFNNDIIHIHFSDFRKKLSKCFGKYYGYAASILGVKKNKNTSVGNYLLIRTDHQTNPLYHKKLNYAPASFAMDIPYGYLAIYANSALTLSDRIHACIVTMAYGGTAMLFSKSPRVQIIEQVGASTIFQKPTKLNMNQLEQIRNAEIDFLKSIINIG